MYNVARCSWLKALKLPYKWRLDLTVAVIRTEGSDGRTGMIGRQFKVQWAARQLLFPISQTLGKFRVAQAVPLPHGKFCVLRVERRERIRAAFAIRLVERRQLAIEYAQRPLVGHDVVHRLQKDVLSLAQFQEPEAQRRSAPQIERLVPLAPHGFAHALILNSRVELGQFLHRNANPECRLDDLDGLAVNLREVRAQSLMPLHNRVDDALQSGDIQHTLQAQRACHVVFRAAAFQPVEKPQTLLGKRQRDLLGTGCRRNFAPFIPAQALTAKSAGEKGAFCRRKLGRVLQ